MVYKPGKEMHIADALSRAYLPESYDDLQDELEVMDVGLIHESRKKNIAAETAKDSTCQQLLKVINDGWPVNIPKSIKEFHAFCDELAMTDGVIMKGQRAVIPRSLQQEYLVELHKGHIGAEAMKRRARECVYWPGINKDIDEYLTKRPRCNSCKPHQQKEPMKSY